MTHEATEFGGPIGCLATTISLPLLTYILATTVTKPKLSSKFFLSFDVDDYSYDGGDLWGDVRGSLLLIMGWIFCLVLCERLTPGKNVKGTKINVNNPASSPGKTRSAVKTFQLNYKINGLASFVVVSLILILGEMKGLVQLSSLSDNFVPLSLAATIISFVLSIYLYATSFLSPSSPHKVLAAGGNTGHVTYDFFLGRELNPRVLNGSFDLKFFCELRPGLIGWCVLNAGMMKKQIELTGSASSSMVLVNIFQFIYVLDALYMEKAILTTMDITTDGFGFMLAFGDLGWVPFTYTLQAAYLVHNDPGIGWLMAAFIVGLKILGYIIFRGANSQKDAFRSDPSHPSVSHLKFIETKRGTKLLVSGFWGMARKINYTGDWVMGLSWSLTCGGGSLIPYFYPIYFAILLIHRSIRDDEMCSDKYGKDWVTYKGKVPYRFIPGVI